MENRDDDFSQKTKDLIYKRASYICSNPDCRMLTLLPSEKDSSKITFKGCAAHIKAASPGGARYDKNMSPDKRKSADNGMHLCRTCGDMIDKNKGIDYPVELLLEWKKKHEIWLIENLNKRFGSELESKLIDVHNDITFLKESGSKLLTEVQKNFELQKRVKSVNVAFEFNEIVDINKIEAFSFFFNLCFWDNNERRQMTLGNVLLGNPADYEDSNKREKKIRPFYNIGWSNNPDKILHKTFFYTGDKRKIIVSKCRWQLNDNTFRIMDLENSELAFYFSEPFVSTVKRVYFIINDLIIDDFSPKNLIGFPAKCSISEKNFIVPDEILSCLDDTVQNLTLVRLGRKEKDLWKKSPMNTNGVESTWSVSIERPIRKVNNLNFVS